MRSRDDVARALMAAADKAREAGEIGFLEHWRVRRVTSRRLWNRMDRDLQETVGEQITAMVSSIAALPPEGTPEADGEILKIILDNLPKILEFITQLLAIFSMFG